MKLGEGRKKAREWEKKQREGNEEKPKTREWTILEKLGNAKTTRGGPGGRERGEKNCVRGARESGRGEKNHERGRGGPEVWQNTAKLPPACPSDDRSDAKIA